MRKAEEILAEAYEASGWKAKANDIRGGNLYEEGQRAVAAIEQAQRELAEEAAELAEQYAQKHKDGEISNHELRTYVPARIRQITPHREG